jgi:hypothetical protein
MRHSINRKLPQPPKCDRCKEPLETPATAQNPSATIMAYSLARCPSCLVLFVIGTNLQPSPDLSADETTFNAAMNADPEVREWAEKHCRPYAFATLPKSRRSVLLRVSG